MLKALFLERRRSRAVKALGVLDTPAEPPFDRIAADAAGAFNAPVALLSLIHGESQWFKAAHGVTIDCIARESGFCGFALDRPGVLETCDPEQDPRFAALPVVAGEPFVRYYIGAPLRLMSGVDVGALCVIDFVRRSPASADQAAYLLALARRASLLLEARSGELGRGLAA